jgi:hypothetical protein
VQIAGGGHDEFTVLDAFNADQFIGNFFDIACLATQHKDFEAVMSVEMNMEGGKKTASLSASPV